jgi:adenylate cyclase class 2
VDRGSCEVEVKYRIYDLDRLVQALADYGLTLSDPVRQDDQAYAEERWQYGMSKLGVAFARLRTQGGRHLFTLKKPRDNEMACLEHETEIADRDQMHDALTHMGFYPTVRIVKTRRTACVGDLSLCLDDVDHAGVFLEVEKMVGPSESASATQVELDGFVRSLGVEVERTHDTYDSLIRSAMMPV